MDALSYKTKFANKTSAEKEWLLVDAENEVVGRLASKVAMLLRVNADKVRFTGKKLTDKEYVRYTGYQGGQRFTTPKELMAKKPTEILTHAIHGMLPKGPLGRELNTNVRIFVGTNHGHEAQQPKKVDLSKIK